MLHAAVRALVEMKSRCSMVKALKTNNSSFLRVKNINIIPNQNAEGQ
jgi:hypothetical protein